VLNSESRETGIALAPDGLSLWFSSDREDSDTLDIYTSVRGARDASWPAPVRVAELSSADDDLVSSLDERGDLLLLARRVNDDDDYDVWSSRRMAAGEPWQAPQPLAGVNTDDEESDAFWVGDGLRLIFTRDGDLMLAQRASLSEAFDRGTPMESLNSDDDDRDAWADAKLDYVIFSSDRDGPHRLYEAVR
jgi:WD40 repeat protein